MGRRATSMALLISTFIAAVIPLSATSTSAGFRSSPEASAPDEVTIELRDLGGDTKTITVADLQALPTETIDTSYLSEGIAQEEHAFTGVRLWDVLVEFGLIPDSGAPEDSLSRYLVLTASDGYLVVIALGEIDPRVGGHPYILAWLEDGRPLSSVQQPIRLIGSGDGTDFRYIFAIATISVHEVREPATS